MEEKKLVINQKTFLKVSTLLGKIRTRDDRSRHVAWIQSAWINRCVKGTTDIVATTLLLLLLREISSALRY